MKLPFQPLLLLVLPQAVAVLVRVQLEVVVIGVKARKLGVYDHRQHLHQRLDSDLLVMQAATLVPVCLLL